MREEFKLILVLITSLLMTGCIYYTVESMNIINHEAVHKEIYEYYGYPANVTIKGLSGSTQALEPIDAEDNKIMYPMHVQNEIVGYNLYTIRVIMYALFCSMWILIGWRAMK